MKQDEPVFIYSTPLQLAATHVTAFGIGIVISGMAITVLANQIAPDAAALVEKTS